MTRYESRLLARRTLLKFLSLLVTVYLAGSVLRYGVIMVKLGHYNLGLTVIACVVWLLFRGNAEILKS